MYRNYGYKRRKKKKNNGFLGIIIFILFIVIGTFSYISFDKIKEFINSNNDVINENEKINNTGDSIIIKDTYYIGDPVLTEGIVTKVDGIFDYTHKLEENNGNIFGIKSNIIDLSTYLGKIQIKGIVVDKKNGVTILNIDEVIESINTEIEALSGDISFEYGTGNGEIPKFGLSLSFNNDYLIKEESESIIVQAIIENNSGTTYEDILTIYPMICKKGSSTRDCENIEKIFAKFDTFVSSNGIKYYKIPETNRYFFSNHVWGYNVTANSNLDIGFLSQYIDYFNLNQIEELLSKYISSYCKDENNKMTNIDDFKYYFGGNTFDSLRLNISGTDENLNKLNCILKINLGNPITTEFIELKNNGVKKNSGTQKENTEVVNIINKPENNNKTESTTENTNNIDKSEYLEFSSKRGYTIYFPSKSIAFQTVATNNSLGIAGMKCNMKINVKNYKEKSELETNPDVEIFDCQTDLDNTGINDFLEGTNMVYKPFKQKKFIVRYNNSNYKEFANKLFFE